MKESHIQMQTGLMMDDPEVRDLCHMISVIVSLHLFVYAAKGAVVSTEEFFSTFFENSWAKIVFVLRLLFHNYYVHTDLFGKFLGQLVIGCGQSLLECPLFKFCVWSPPAFLFFHVPRKR